MFWVTGLSGAGKSAISKKILPFINKKYGPTLSFSGDELRKLLDLNKYSKMKGSKLV